jgi:hypothetical protein
VPIARSVLHRDTSFHKVTKRPICLTDQYLIGLNQISEISTVIAMTHSRWFRIALGYLGLVSLQIGTWAVLAPQSFYDNFPGFGRVWVSVDGPFNEHLIRDVGALNLALFSLIVYAAVTLSKQLIRAASVASLFWGVPHLIYHVFNTVGLETSDLVANLGGLAVSVALPVFLLANTSKLEHD